MHIDSLRGFRRSTELLIDSKSYLRFFRIQHTGPNNNRFHRIVTAIRQFM